MHPSPFPYLDPGSGSLLIQILIAVVLGLGVALRASWGKIKTFFGRGKSREAEERADDERD